MQVKDFVILEQMPLARDVLRLVLGGTTEDFATPGQFVNVRIEGCYLRRPISVCDWDKTSCTLIYKVIGEGTARLAARKPGEKLNLLTGLGNGFSLLPEVRRPLLVGGGVGVPPLYGLAKRLCGGGDVRPLAILGFQGAADVFYEKEFAALGQVTVATADGSQGTKGFVTDALDGLLPGSYDALYACGPEAMLRALWERVHLPPGRAQYSFERRMACGFGACMVCSCRTVSGSKRICKEGPVLFGEEILF
ncbi:MAG: dihydroorotate dehydrogenase electron transfer subunit [Oscillospiraceae bacterium]|jgi:dihydroorotate dehydrogenase electron transfer subunit|nr:dihydroorotate dehydrogenase electron transfer subunit [Oscillospiraceae bacterium]